MSSRTFACLLLCLYLYFTQNVSADTELVQLEFDGGSPICPDTDCQPGQYCLPSFECDSSPTWHNGTRTFDDPLGSSCNVITMITVTISGVFGCGSSHGGIGNTVHLYLQDSWVGDLSVLPTANCTCRNCAGVWPYNRYVSGWAPYKYGKKNTIQIHGDLPVCLSNIAILFTYSPTCLPTTLTSTTHSSTTHATITTTASTTNGTDPITPEPHSLVVVGAVMLSGMVFVNMCVVGGWYALKKKPENGENGERENSGGEIGIPWDKQLHYKDIQMGERIGRGSFGEVYLASWFSTRVAVKKLPMEMLKSNASVLDEFTREIHLLKSLRHPNILQFIGACTIPPNVCLVTEFMPRGDLHKIIHDKSLIMDKPLMKSILLDVSRGINYLHSSNPVVIHRDLKSHNVLIGEHWNAKVADFGLCKIIQSWEETSKYTPCGTPKWAAPEVLRNEVYTTKADVYSFAIILWEITTRQDPFPGMSAFELIVQVGKHGLRPGQIPDSNPLGNLILECWDDNPKLRPSFERILSILEAW